MGLAAVAWRRTPCCPSSSVSLATRRLPLPSSKTLTPVCDPGSAHGTGFEQKSLFKSFEEAGLTWASYFALGPSPLVFKDVRVRESGNFHHFTQFEEHARLGQLPTFTHIDPRYFSTQRTSDRAPRARLPHVTV